MIVYGNIGFTRGGNTPAYWNKDFRLTEKSKQLINALHAHRQELYNKMDNLPDSLTDEEYNAEMKKISIALESIIIEEDKIRRSNAK